MKHFIHCILITLSACVLLLAGACEYFHNSPLEVTSYSPEEEIIAPGTAISIWVRFSTDVERTLTEQAFSLSENDEELPGRITWEGNKLFFVPFKILTEGNIYVLRVDTTAEDCDGNSLSHVFTFRFSIGDDLTRPRIIRLEPLSPPDNEAEPPGGFPAITFKDPLTTEQTTGRIRDRLAPLCISFSEPLDQASFYKAISIIPQLSGAYTWQPPGADGHVNCIFTPYEEYRWNTEYTLTLNTELKDRHNNALAENYSIRFIVGTMTDATPPAIISVENNSPESETGHSLVAGITYNTWEANWSIRIIFSETISDESLGSNIRFSPQVNYETICDPQFPGQVILKPADCFTYGETYVLTIGKDILDSHGLRLGADAVYRFRVAGPRSRPPKITAAYYVKDRNNPGPAMDQPLENLDEITIAPNLSSATIPETIIYSYFDLSISCADGATIPAVSLAQHFQLSSSSKDVSFTILSFSILNPDPTENEKHIRVLIQSRITSGDTINSCLITLSMNKEFYDSAGNKMLTDWKLILRNKLTPTEG